MVSIKTISHSVACLLCGVQAGPTVKLGNGMTVLGRTSPIAPSVAEFMGIPYAKPPVGFILNSGTAHLNQLMSNDVVYSNFSFVAEGLGCGNQPNAASELACMKKVPAEKLENFVATYEDSGDSPSITFAPMVDEKLVFGNYTDRAARGALSTLPALITHNAQEGLFIAPYSVDGPDPEIADGLSRTFFWCPTYKTTKERLAAGRVTHRAFYNGNFTNISPRPWMGAWHGSDLPLAFGTHADFRGNSTALEIETSHAIQDAYVAFVKDPVNGLNEMGWAAYTAPPRCCSDVCREQHSGRLPLLGYHRIHMRSHGASVSRK
ncbi:chlorogenic acid esterase precursor [Apiospora saccharicola]|uniref:Chlorogenic acid esterase n=1 Tax=Apiospora saccharicola TaxID=335842 RepID=A0ABR1WEA6_9PEZI